MTRRKFSKLLKPVAMVSTVLSAGVMLSLPAMAQVESQAETSQEIELSPDALEILCERSPLNSRCEGGTTEARDTTTIDDQFEERIDPAETDPAEAVSDPSSAPVDQTPEGTSTPSYEMQQDPGLTPAPAPDEGGMAPKETTETPVTPDATAPAAPGTSPETSPDAVAPTPPDADTSAPAASISETELQQFAEAVPQIQAIERTTQQEVVQTIEESGFSRERFSQLYQQQTSGAAIEPTPTTEEEQTFTQAYSDIQKIQQDAQSEREQVIVAQGLEPQRFDQILAAVLQDPALQQQVQSMMAQ